jgi:hypothetical protein
VVDGLWVVILAFASSLVTAEAEYHFIRPHMSLREELSQPIARTGRQIPKRYRARTPAIAVGITDHRWTVREFLSYPLPEALG